MKKNIYKLLYFISEKIIKSFYKINIYKVKSDEKYKNIIENYEHKELYSNDTFKDVPISKEKYDLSIIIPVYNSEKYLEKCLDSLVNQQTKYKYQIICINDGSTDKSLEILNNYKKKFDDFFIINQKNGGISAARNAGIKASSGLYLGFIDNDDWVTSNYIEKLLSRAYENNADIVKCNHVNYSIDLDAEVGVIRHNDASIKKFGLEILEFKGYIWGGIIKKSLFKEIRFPEGYWYEDVMMRFTLMRMANDFEFIDENLYYYALHKTNASKTLWKKDNVKTLDFYFLLKDLCSINKSMKIDNDITFYNQLLYELGPNFWLRTRKLKSKFQKTLFNYICDLHDTFYKEEYNSFYGMNKYISVALSKRNYFLWQLVSFNIICGVHLDYVK